ncbi:pyridoxamine 5'-phosphate oxidase family protein [Chryseobacterium sp.]|uniref:HugZ family pyridoxamine 5'-phosphate oxidase n=1 Tax=Chryseobacterium sp. TaxID=1871047 RepID=UPI0025BD6E31|nr:pyridoxamine 5'-phosphate oxidase family protein [Chryseobacterium sp.]MBV8325714.1 pyridoxamine 5'-phosphate oxidase family protein [Chryseobacterium sp.]
MNHTHTEKKAKPVAPKVIELIARTKSIILATTDGEGNPNSSYAPFVRVDETFYILVSFMAKHTRNLSAGRKVSVLFIEDESAAKQIYARERLTLETFPVQVERDSEQWNRVVEKLAETHGKVVDVISEMGDFILIALRPVRGSYVNGFGSAYFVDENLEIIEHRNDVNHKSNK